MTAIRLVVSARRDAISFFERRSVREPSLLVSYWYAKASGPPADYPIREWVLDSGAFSAHNSGAAISNQEYMAFAREAECSAFPPAEVFALDVIGDPVASLHNAQDMVAAGFNCIPTFHLGEPIEILQELAANFPKIAIGGLVGQPSGLRVKFVEQVFAHVWPKPMHAFGVVQESILMNFPFHTADASNWVSLPRKFMRWRHLGGERAHGAFSCKRSTHIYLGREVDYYIDYEERLAARWSRELQQLKEMLR